MAEYSKEDIAKLNGYTLTAAEQRLLEVLVNPANVGLSVTEKCKLANISRTTYYDLMQKPEFLQALNKTALLLIRDRVADVLNATYKFAMQSRNHQDRKLLLELFDLYANKQKVEVSGDNGEPIKLATLSEEEKKELLKNIAKRVANEEENTSNLQNST